MGGHGGWSTRQRPAEERFHEKVRLDESGCHIWEGVTASNGYGTFYPARGSGIKAHRWAYEERFGPLGLGIQVHHKCGRTNCVNPEHMEAVTPKQHSAKHPRDLATHCLRGHLYDEANTYVSPKGTRFCRACQRINFALSRERRGLPPHRPRVLVTHCKYGHPYDRDNTVFGSKGDRVCRTCRNEHNRRYKREARARAAAGGRI